MLGPIAEALFFLVMLGPFQETLLCYVQLWKKLLSLADYDPKNFRTALTRF